MATTKTCVLLSEDDEALRETLTQLLREEGYDTVDVRTLDDVRAQVASSRRCVLLLDSGLADDESAVQWLGSLAARDDGPPTIIVSGSKGAGRAARALL